MKFAIALLCLVSTPAFAATKYCTDTQNGDYLITLQLEGGKIVRASYMNQDHGDADDAELAPSDVTQNADGSITYGGDVYLCTAAQ